MAVNFDNLTYAGEHYTEVFGPAVLDPMGLIDNGLATGIDSVKFKSTVNEIDDVVELKNPSPTFASQAGNAKVDEVNLTTVPFEFHKTITLADLRKSWFSPNIPKGTLNDYEYNQLVDMYLRNVYVPKLKFSHAWLQARGKVGLPSEIGSFTFTAAYEGLYPKLLNNSNSTLKLGTNTGVTIVSFSKATQAVLGFGSGEADKIYIGTYITFGSVAGSSGTNWSGLNGTSAVVIAKSGNSVTLDLNTSGFTGTYTASSGKASYINRSNIVELTASVVTRAKLAVRRNPMAKIVMPGHLEDEWQFALAEVNQNGGGYYQMRRDASLIDKDIKFVDNAPENTIGFWTPDRVFVGFDLDGEESNVEVLWQGATGNKFYNMRGGIKSIVEISKLFQNDMVIMSATIG